MYRSTKQIKTLPARPHFQNVYLIMMVQSQMMYCKLAGGFDYYKIETLQKTFVKIISSGKYNAHSEPLFHVLVILNIEHRFSQSRLICVYRLNNVNHLNTNIRTHITAKCIRSHLSVRLNDTPDIIINKLNTHTEHSSVFYFYQAILFITMYNSVPNKRIVCM